jgi:hypothetical protein
MTAYNLTSSDTLSIAVAATARLRPEVQVDGQLRLIFQANLRVSPRVVAITPITPGLMRVTFGEAMLLTSTLLEVANWSISSINGAGARVTKITPQPGTSTPLWLDFTTTEHTQGANYEAWCNGLLGFPVSATGVPTSAGASRAPYIGLGEAPIISAVRAVGRNRADVVFGEPMDVNVALGTAARYLFDNGLVVVSVAAVSSDTVSLVTSDQTPNTLYELTLSSPTDIRDAARNQISGAASGSMIGWLEPEVQRDTQPLSMYDFIIEDIRNEDQTTGTLILKRLLEGPQDAWTKTHQNVLELGTLYSPSGIREELLVHLKRIVGLGPDLDKITDRLDTATLRRLISIAANMWKWRGTEDTLTGILTLLIGAQSWVCNWFHYRWIVEETGLGNLISNDPWVIAEADEDLYNLRIVDRPTGSLDRILVGDLANLLRPSNEVVEVTYLLFLERFLVDGDTTQWEAFGPGASITVSNNIATITGSIGASFDNGVIVAVEGSEDWQSYTLTAKVKIIAGSLLIVFGFQDVNNTQYVVLASGTDMIAHPASDIGEVLAVLFENSNPHLTANTATPIYPGEWNGIKIDNLRIGIQLWEVSIYLNNELINTIQLPYDCHGKIGFATSDEMQVAFVEMIEVPTPTGIDVSNELGDEMPFVLG